MLHQTEMESRLVSYFRACAEFTPYFKIKLKYILQYYNPAHSAFGSLLFVPAANRGMGTATLAYGVDEKLCRQEMSSIS